MNMDLIGVTSVRTPRTRAEIALGPRDRVIGGGTWLYSEPQSGFDTVVDLTTLGWPEIEECDDVVSLAATCRLSTVHALRGRDWVAAPLFGQATEALLASTKIWNVATIGGNLCFGVPASAMVSLCTALDAAAVIWDAGADAASTAPGERRVRVADLILGPQRRAMAPTEIVRAIEFPRAALGERTAFRKIALAELGRSGAVVIGRATREGALVSVTAATARPHVLRGDRRDILAALERIDDWYDDDHGSPDWRAAMARRFVGEVLDELGTEASA